MTTPNVEIPTEQEATNAAIQATPDDSSRVAAAVAALEADETAEPAGENGGEDRPPAEGDAGREPDVAAAGDSEAGTGEDPGDADPPPLESSRLAELSRRERAAREQYSKKEAELAAKEQSLEAQLTELKQIKAQLANQADAFYSDPIKALEAIGVKGGYGELAHILMAAELGEDPPEEYTGRLANKRMETELERIRRETDEKLSKIEQERQQAQFEEFQRGYVGKMDTFVRQAPTAEMPFLATWYSTEPSEVLEMMYADAYDMAEQDPTAPLPEPGVLAKRLNQKLESKLGPILAKLIELQLASIQEEPNPAPQASTGSTRTLRNAHNARTNPTPPANTEEERMRRALAILEANE